MTATSSGVANKCLIRVSKFNADRIIGFHADGGLVISMGSPSRSVVGATRGGCVGRCLGSFRSSLFDDGFASTTGNCHTVTSSTALID